MKKVTMSAVALTAIFGSMSSLSAADAQSGVGIFNDAKFSGEIRPRYEYADVDNDVDAGNAFTARTHLKAKANLLGVDGLSTTIGIQSVNNFGSNSYNSTDNKAVQYDKIVDPQFAMLSEASLDYSVGKTTMHAGRSKVNLDNQRFIGTAGWKQNERSYDTVYVANSDVEDLTLLAAYVYGYQGVKANNTADTSSILLNAKYKIMDELTVTAYDYMLAVGHQDVDSDTIGLALTGKIDAGAKLTYRAEYAIQKDATLKYHDVNTTADATYMNFDLGANISGVLIGGNYEVLSGSDSNGKTKFTTPLGTNHKFNGWADMFLSTPSGGLADLNARLGYETKGFGKLLGVYHMFSADTAMPTSSGTGNDLGSEIDVVYVNAIPGVKNLKGLVKFASYSKGEVVASYSKKGEVEVKYNNKQVAWLQLDYKF